MYDVIIGHYGKDKNIPFGGQKLSYRVETLHTGWGPLALQHIFRFFENLENFGFCDNFSKKSDFLKFLESKKQNLKIRDSHFVDLAFLFYPCFVCIWLKNSIFGEFSNIYLLSAQNRGKWRHKIRPIAKNFRPILIFFTRDGAKLMPGEVCQVSCRCSNKWRSYSGKTEVGRIRPPRRWRVKDKNTENRSRLHKKCITVHYAYYQNHIPTIYIIPRQ